MGWRMTEVKWLACRDPHVLFVRRKGVPLPSRKVRPAICGAYRRVWERMSVPARLGLEVVEAFADGRAGKAQLLAAQATALRTTCADWGVRSLAEPNERLRMLASNALDYAARSLPEAE